MDVEAIRSQLARIPSFYPPADHWVENLPRQSLADCSEAEACSICMEPLCSSGQNDAHEALKLPCSHIFGKECLRIFLTYGNSCPMCRKALPEFATQENREEDYRSFLIWDFTQGGKRTEMALLDRHYQAHLAIEDAKEEVAWFWESKDVNGGLSTFDYLYLHNLELITGLSPESFERIEDINAEIDALALEYKERMPDRTPPPATVYCRKIEITNMVAYFPGNNHEAYGLEEGEIYQHRPIQMGPGFTDPHITEWEPWLHHCFSKDFEGVPRDQMHDELRARRVIYALMCSRVEGPTLEKFAAEAAARKSDQDMAAFAKREKIVKKESREYHFQLSEDSDTLEFSELVYWR